MAAPRVSFKTIGCRLNQAETETMAGAFHAAGYSVVPFGSPCDVAVVHGCSVTLAAERKSIRAARFARSRKATRVVLAGCPAQLDPAGMQRKSGADIIANQAGKLILPDMLESPGGLAESGVHKSYAIRKPHFIPGVGRARAFLMAQDGCDFRCAYCVVPDARGTPRSRPADELVEEAAMLVSSGFHEIVILGANLGCYRDGAAGLTDLVRRIAVLRGIERIRLSSIEPGTCERSIIDLMADHPCICRFLHVPMQSGDDGTLLRMRRRYDTTFYRKFVDHASARLGSFGLGTDVIVGFPGENDESFGSTVRMVEELPFTYLHVFPFSRRPGTPAEGMTDQVSPAVIAERARQLRTIGEAKKNRFAESFRGRMVTALVERVRSGRGHGWTPEYVEARVTGRDLRDNTLVSFVPDRVEDGCLLGKEGHPPSLDTAAEDREVRDQKPEV